MNKELILSYLDEKYPNAYCELKYTKDYELLIAVMLSAQTTDKSVNEATAILFKKYPTCEELAKANVYDVERIISHLGMYQVKAKNVVKIAQRLVQDYKGHVPNDPEALLSLPGVGNKTKNCVLAELYNEPLLAVDTHMQRFAKRMGIANEKDSVEVIEQKYIKFIPKERIVKTNHQIIWFGRYFCKAISPDCEHCKLREICRK
ncbi:MAG: endonuclease III [Firmicutes bacterium]|nr:endonuclease III [Candidatus Fiminaster equi]